MPVVTAQRDSRLNPPTLQARLVRKDGLLRLESPTVGLYRGEPAPGAVVAAGAAIGQLEILGVLHHLLAPAEAAGVVVAQDGPRLARHPVGHGDLLVALDPEAAVAGGKSAGAGPAAGAAARDALVFRAPTSGRLYLRGGPGKPPLVQAGDRIVAGQAVALIEVMKTFSRLHYGGEGLPSPARVVAILARDEDDVAAGDPLFELAAAD
jgi:acetyl-CoA carboxylase biotin carboxyl carrier protein